VQDKYQADLDAATLHAEVSKLDAAQRDVLSLLLGGNTFAHIATKLGRSQDGVRGSFRTAVRRLLKRLSALGVWPQD
jgi:hypothetical protein